MKRIAVVLLFFAFRSYSQHDTAFYYTYGGTNFDEARDIKETRNKGYILAGTTSSFGPGMASVYIIKTDSLGNHKWSNVYGGAQNDWGYYIDTTYDGGFFVAGYSNSFYTGNSFDYSAYYFKTDGSGNILWQKFTDNGANSFIYSACAMPDSGYVLCGKTYATSYGTADAYLIRVDKNGNTLWTNHYGDSLDEVFNSVCIINNRLYAVGSNGSHAGADSLADGWIVKLNMGGTFLKDTFVTYGAKQQETLNGITPYNDSLFTVCGANNYLDNNATVAIINKYDTALKINQNITSNNNLLGDSSIAGVILTFNKIVNISYGNICAIGSANGGLGGTDMFLMGFNSGGWFIQNGSNFFLYHAGGIYNDYGYSGLYSSGGRVINVGSTQSGQSFCTNPNLGLEDVFLVRLNTDSIYNDSIPTTPKCNCFADTLYFSPTSIKNYGSNNNVKLFPNPASSAVNLFVTSANNESYTVKIFSVLGEEVMNLNVNTNTSASMDVSGLSNGTYFIKVQDGNQQNISVLKFIISR